MNPRSLTHVASFIKDLGNKTLNDQGLQYQLKYLQVKILICETDNLHGNNVKVHNLNAV